MVEQTADTPKLPQEEANGNPSPGPTPWALSIAMGWEEPSHSTRGAQRAQPHHGTASMTPKEALCCPNPTWAHHGQETCLSFQPGQGGTHRIKRQLKEGTTTGHLVQPPCSSRVTQSALLRVVSRWLLSISREEDSTTSPGTYSSAQSHSKAALPYVQVELPTASLLGKHQANKLSVLTVLPALDCQQGTLLATHLHPLQPAMGRVPPSPLNHHKNHTFGSLKPKLPKMLLPPHQAAFRDTSKPPLPFHWITTTTDARPPSSRRYPGPPPMP